MMKQVTQRFWHVGLIVLLAAPVLAGCGGGQAASGSANTSGAETYTSAVLVTSYTDALDASGQLALGTLELEGTLNTVTPEQAKSLLPLWQALQGGVTAQTEVNAVLKQIEGTMTQGQLLAIAAMQLTQEDLQIWMQENNVRPGGVFTGTMQWQGGTPGPEATRQAEFGGGPPGGGRPDNGTLSPEMATRGAEFANMSDAEREAMRATMQAGGGPGGPSRRSGGGFGGSRGQFMILLNPLIQLLETRAGEA